MWEQVPPKIQATIFIDFSDAYNMVDIKKLLEIQSLKNITPEARWLLEDQLARYSYRLD